MYTVQIYPHSCQHLLLSIFFFFFTIAVWTGGKWCFIVALISLKTNDWTSYVHIGHLWIKKCLFKFFAHFWTALFLLWNFFMCSGYKSDMICRYFLLSCQLSFHFLKGIICSINAFNSDVVQFLFFTSGFGVYLGNHCLLNSKL